jgi:purine catabolism regulator
MWRAFDVGAVVESLIDDAVVVAGRGGTARKVSRAQVVTTVDALARVRSDELVVTTIATLSACDEPWPQLIERLDAARISAIAVQVEGSSPLPEGLISAANQLDVPVIALPGASGLADVTNVVLDALLQAQGRRVERFLEIHQRFTPIVLAGGGATQIATTLNALLGCPIAITDRDARMIVLVPSDARDLSGDAPNARQRIMAGDHDYGEVIAFIPESELDEDGRLALERASAALAVRMAHATAAAAELERFAATSLEELISGHAGNAVDVTERATSFGWDLTRPRAVLLASIDPPTEPDALPSTLSTIAAAARATLGAQAIVWTRSTTIAALVAPETDSPEERRALAEGLRQELDRRVRNVTISIGVGRRVEDPTTLPRSYTEASRAVEVGRWAKARHVTEIFDQLGLERLLASASSEDLAEFVEHAIGQLIAHDRDSGADLVDSLGMWLGTRNMAEAARQMFVHYNTFKNRLDRIESILGPVVADAARSLECEVAIYVYRHYDGPWSPHT